MIDPPRYNRPGSHLDFFLNIQHVHGQKMIDRGGDCYTKDLLPARVTTYYKSIDLLSNSDLFSKNYDFFFSMAYSLP